MTTDGRSASSPPPSYECPWCGMVSYHPMDLQERFCARCDKFEDEPRASA